VEALLMLCSRSVAEGAQCGQREREEKRTRKGAKEDSAEKGERVSGASERSGGRRREGSRRGEAHRIVEAVEKERTRDGRGRGR
jgi:hypothetical protein